MKRPAVYIMASQRNGTLYTGVTSSLVHRAWQHREGLTGGFTRRYGCKLLVWFELHATMPDAIAREKQIKGGSRKSKLALIEAMNPTWEDLFPAIAHS
jgi:predicted GIY-YIG superfamily endonuclease